jgi:hypothetical protein
MEASPAKIITSADGAAYVKGLTWHGWGDATATGTGVLELNDCTPNCGSGTVTAYPATVSLSGLSTYASGQAAYAAMTVSAPTAPASRTLPPFTSGLVP